MTGKPQLLLALDANALIHRAYHAIPPLTSRSGEPTNATFGFASTLLKVLEDFEPELVAAAFDVGRTFRHELYTEYKAQRDKAPDDLLVQLKRSQEIVEAFGIPACSVPGYEADDILATLSQQALAAGLEVIIVTGDTDTLQLVRPGVRVYMVGRKFSEGMLYDVEQVKRRYGLAPEQLVDYKSLCGDTSDNIPGVPGIGPKTATTLLQEYGSVEGIYQNVDRISERWRAKLLENKNAVLQGKQLVKLVRDVPIRFDPSHGRISEYDRQRVMELFRELGFWRLVSRLPAEQPQQKQLSLFDKEKSAIEAAESVPGDYRIADTPERLAALVAELAQSEAFAVDVETTGLDPLLADLVGISMTARAGQGHYVPVGHEQDAGQSLPLDLAREQLAPLLADERIKKYAHNASFDLAVLENLGMTVKGLAFDTMVAAYLLDPGRRNLGLKQLAWERFGVEMTPITDLIGTGRKQITTAQVPVSRVAAYAAADADMTLRLVEPLRRELEEKELWRLYEQVELPLIPVLIEMERNGVALDIEFLAEMSKDLAARLAELEEKIYAAVGHPFNINSTKQLGDVLFEELGLPAPRRTKTGYSTDADVMEALRGKHPVIDALMEYRQLSKLKSTYVDALPALVNPNTGRLHTSYNQTGTVTGRLSSSNPNLQNIPIRSDIGREVRRAFIAPPGCWLLEADYSQVELRILAHISGDQALREAFWRGEDIHARTAASILGVELQDVTPNMRRIAKSINFGLIYGMSDFGLASRTGLSREEAAKFIANYFARYPQVRGYLETTKRKARRDGWVETLLGRRRYFPELQAGSQAHNNLRQAAERMAINMPIQGTAADIIKLAMIEMHHTLHREGLQSKMTLQVHDELVFEVPEEELELMCKRVRNVMENIFPLSVPLKVEINVGKDWQNMAAYGDAHTGV